MAFTFLGAQTQKGKATFYSKRATGARTASGERLHHDSMTCAHRTHPFGTMLKVTNPANGKEVIVKVTDRGPFSRGRIIDLSWGAAKVLDILDRGVATVTVEKVTPDHGVPFKLEKEALPEIDFEVADREYDLGERWRGQPKEPIATAKSNSKKPKAPNPEPKKVEPTPHNKSVAPKNATPGNQKVLPQKEDKLTKRILEKMKSWFKDLEEK